MRLPWNKPEVLERREAVTPSGDYSRDLVALLLSNAAGTSLRGGPAVLEIAAGMWSRAFATARVSPDNSRTAGLDSATLAAIGRRLLMRGQFVAEIEVRGGVVHLAEAQQWEVYGGRRPESWLWELTFDGPTRQERRTVGAGRVLNLTYAVDANRPWQGCGPLNAAGITQSLLTHLETRLAQEANAAAGNIVPIPDTAQAGTLQEDLRRADGRLTLVDSTVDWGQGAENRPSQDWQPRRLGANPPAGVIELRAGAEKSVLAACGVPVTMLAESDGSGKREDYRRFLHSTMMPLGKIIGPQLDMALGTSGIEFDWRDLGAGDISGRARSFSQLVGAGMAMQEAAANTGILNIDD